MTRDPLVLRDLSACWCDEQGRLGPAGQIRPMRMLVAPDGRAGAEEGQARTLPRGIWGPPIRLVR
jgi:hypothetical protein